VRWRRKGRHAAAKEARRHGKDAQQCVRSARSVRVRADARARVRACSGVRVQQQAYCAPLILLTPVCCRHATPLTPPPPFSFF